MKEVVIILLIIAFYSFISYLIYRFLMRVKPFVFVLICLAYLLFTNYLFDFLIYGHQLLRSKGIYLEFGHADIVLLEVFAVCILIAVINIIIAIIKKYKKKKNSLHV